MAHYKLHCFCQSGNSYKVALYLSCAGIEWEPVFVDFMSGATRDETWRKEINAMGEVPVLEVDGRRLTQSGAILVWLAEKTGKFAPRTEDDRFEALRWILFDNHKFTSYFATYRFLRSFAATPPDPAVLAFLKGRIDGTLGIVNEHLSRTPYVIGDAPTIADFSMAGYMYYPIEEHGFDFERTHVNIYTWAQRLKALPGWKDPYALLPGKRIAPRHAAV
jgi:glutathione S-transferase